ncbi:hypothetical protein IFVP182_C190022 [Vibrio parahaemolyticus]
MVVFLLKKNTTDKQIKILMGYLLCVGEPQDIASKLLLAGHTITLVSDIPKLELERYIITQLAKQH